MENAASATCFGGNLQTTWTSPSGKTKDKCVCVSVQVSGKSLAAAVAVLETTFPNSQIKSCLGACCLDWLAGDRFCFSSAAVPKRS